MGHCKSFLPLPKWWGWGEGLHSFKEEMQEYMSTLAEKTDQFSPFWLYLPLYLQLPFPVFRQKKILSRGRKRKQKHQWCACPYSYRGTEHFFWFLFGDLGTHSSQVPFVSRKRLWGRYPTTTTSFHLVSKAKHYLLWERKRGKEKGQPL